MKALVLAVAAAAALAGAVAVSQVHAADSKSAVQPVPGDIAALKPSGAKHVIKRAGEEDDVAGTEAGEHEDGEND